MAPVGPILAGIQTTDGELLNLNNLSDGVNTISVRQIAPRDLTIRFDANQQINAATLNDGNPSTTDGLRITRAGFDGQFGSGDVPVRIGFVGLGDRQNEVVVRFAENLPDDLYRIELFGSNDPIQNTIALRNVRGEAVGDTTADGVDNGQTTIVDFNLDLGAQVASVVPQPVTRNSTTGLLEQARDKIIVYFNNDDLFTENDASGNPTSRSAENPAFYQLIFTRDTVTNTDDVTVKPTRVDYNPDADTATLTFAQPLDQLRNPADNSVIGPGTFRLRIGTDEVAPPPPQFVTPNSSTTTDFNTGGAARITFTAKSDLARSVNLQFQQQDLGVNVAPLITVVDSTIDVVLNTNGTTPTTAQALKAAIDGDPQASALVTVSIAGTAGQPVAATATPNQLLRVAGLGSSFATASDLGSVFDTTGTFINVTGDGVAFVDGQTLSITNVVGVTRVYEFNSVGGSTGIAVPFTPADSPATIAASLRTAINNTAGFGVQATLAGSRIQLTNAQRVTVGQSVTGLTTTSQQLVLQSSIDPQQYAFDFPGNNEEPGHRDVPNGIGAGLDQHISSEFGVDTTPGVKTIPYNFRPDYGVDSQGQQLSNFINDDEKQRVREALALWSRQLGVQFVETPRDGLTFVRGDLVVLDSNDPAVIDRTGLGYITRRDPLYQSSMIVLDGTRQWNDEFGQDFFQRTMSGIGLMLGLERSLELPNSTLMNVDGTPTPELIYPGNIDILHGQMLHRLDSNDIDLYRFTIDLQDQNQDEKKVGFFTAETFAERLATSSPLDTVLTLYKEEPVFDDAGNLVGHERTLLARNDNYFSKDSLLNLQLGTGTYYIAVTSTGNTGFDPTLEDTGFGGRTQGQYELRLNYRSQVDDEHTITDRDRIAEDRSGTPIDGDADGLPGGVHNFWFQVQPLNRAIQVVGEGTQFTDGQTFSIRNSAGVTRVFEFNSVSGVTTGRVAVNFSSSSTAATIANELVNKIGTAGIGVTATLDPADNTRVILSGEQAVSLGTGVVGLNLKAKTFFVDKTSGTNLNGSLAKPFDNLSVAFGAALPGDIVRIVGNGGIDGDPATLNDNFAYEVGFGTSGGPAVLSDGSEVFVPKGVTAMVDAGAMFKMRRSHITVGSSSLGSGPLDRSNSALQILGTPHLLDNNGNVLTAGGQQVPGNVYFTSYLDPSLGRNTLPSGTTPAAGDWGGLVFRNDVDSSEGRFNLEQEGIFLNNVNYADMRFGGGGNIRIDGVDQVVTPIQILQMRPTVAFNTITRSADSAMSADPDSFEETNFHSSRYQLSNSFTSDYERIGPEIHGNILTGNSGNGLFVRINTPVGTELNQLTVPGRFDDTDIVHIIQENLEIEGQPGGAVLDVTRPAVTLVSTVPQLGGRLTAGTYNYKVVFVDPHGIEGRPSEATLAATITAGTGQASIRLTNLPPVTTGFLTRRIYRSSVGATSPYQLVAELDATSGTFVDTGATTGRTLTADPPPTPSSVVQAAGNLPAGTYNYRVVFVDAAGKASPASDASANLSIPGSPFGGGIQVNVPASPAGATARRVYRSQAGGIGPYELVATIGGGGATSVADDGSVTNGAVLDTNSLGVLLGRPSARLVVDPGTVVKLLGARFETSFGAQVIAEGVEGQSVIFTSKVDDRFGAGGTFDTNNDDGANEATPSRGDWGGFYTGFLGGLSLDHALLAYGGGDDNKIEGTFKGFNVVEIHQADARITNSTIEQNEDGVGGQGPASRFGRADNVASTIFIRGAQPVLVNNVFQNNDATTISINTDALTANYLPDPGRSTGLLDRFDAYRDNQGPLIRDNQIANDRNGAILGMHLRNGLTLATESVWDDTDIVHYVNGSINVGNFHTSGGLTLKSSSTESLVVKFSGPGNVGSGYITAPNAGAGLTATGTPLELADRIGGSLYILGQPGFPVVLTSLADDTVGAGFQPNGLPLTDTNNNGPSRPQPNDWRGIRLERYSNDRNVETILEQESINAVAPGANATPIGSQFVGELAGDEKSSDENLRLGFVVHGAVSQPNDVDVYGFTAVAGSEVWFDLDNSRYALDTVIDVLDANGNLLAQSDDSLGEILDPASVYSDDALIANEKANPLAKLADVYQQHQVVSGDPKDFKSLNPRDAGLRLQLPGQPGVRSSFFVRVRSSSLDVGDASSDLQDVGTPNNLTTSGQLLDGLTSGVYQLQMRLREADEIPGSTIRYADIRYARNGVETNGLPAHSPLLGEAAEDETEGYGNNFNFTLDTANPDQRPQDLGNLFASDRATISVAGSLSGSADVDVYQFDVRYTQIGGANNGHAGVTFDLDYANGLGRANSVITVFTSGGVPVLIGRDSNIAEDRPEPVTDVGDPTGVHDLSRGSVGDRDPFIGTAMLPLGSYTAVVSSNAQLPDEIVNNVNVRLEPVNSVTRIAEDRIGSFGGSTAGTPVVPVLFDPTFVGTSLDPANLWHVSNIHASEPGHGILPAFDGSRVSTFFGAGVFNEIETNNTVATANALESRIWSLAADANIGDLQFNTSTTIPHMTVTGTGNGSFDFYSFVVSEAGARGILDIDNSSPSFDSAIFLFDNAGNLLASNDNLLATDTGSTVGTDSYLDFTFPAAGMYVVGVGKTGATAVRGALRGSVPNTGDSYQLHVSITGHATPNGLTPNNGGQSFYFGQEATNNYNIGGRAVGQLVSNAFSLEGYSASDKPVVYFNYRLNTDAFTDAFRLYVSQDGGGAPRLVASSLFSEIGPDVTQLRNDDAWRQARIELDPFAGLGALRLRFEFDSVNGNFNNFEGAFLDDVIIGFAERGEMIVNASSNTAFAANPRVDFTESLTGEYQLEIRRGADYGRTVRTGFFNNLVLEKSIDTNDRNAQQLTMIAPSGSEIVDGQFFQLGDGVNSLLFEYDSDGNATPGRVRISFAATDSAAAIATRIRDAINTPSVQAALMIEAASADGSATGPATDGRINLFGPATADIVEPSLTPLTVDVTVDDANLLRDRLLGSGVTATPATNATYVGATDVNGFFRSAGFFSNGGSSIGIDSGVVLSTGDISAAAGPNANDNSSGLASGGGDADLDTAFLTTTTDAASLTFRITLATDGLLYFNYVFASEEYNELANVANPDAFAVFVDGVNIASVAGSSRVSRNTVNGGNPLGVAAQNAPLYNNNDPSDAGAFQRQFGYDGFSDVFTVSVFLNAGVPHTIKFALADVGDTQRDTAVFVQAGTLGMTDPSTTISLTEPTPITAIRHDGFGDANTFRDQGQILIHSNTISNSYDFGILADDADRDLEAGTGARFRQPHSGPVRNFPTLNNSVAGGTSPGLVIVNNTISGEGLGGIHVSGNWQPWEITPLRGAAFPYTTPSTTWLDMMAGDRVCDGETFSITSSYGHSVRFEWEDLTRHDPTHPCGLNPDGGDGWTPGNVPVFYRRSRLIAPTANGFTEAEMRDAILTALNRSLLVDNPHTIVSGMTAAQSYLVGDLLLGRDNSIFLEHISSINSGSFRSAFLDVQRANQPFARVVNNTIYGHDGNSSSSPDPVTEPNDTLETAIDTKKGRANYPLTFTALSTIGDSINVPNASQDVDFYQFQLGIFERVQVDIAAQAINSPLRPRVRLFNAVGQEMPIVVPPIGDPSFSFTATEPGTYFVAVSAIGNDVYSPQSLADRVAAPTSGQYRIDLTVFASRKWVIDATPAITAAVTYQITSVGGAVSNVTVGPLGIQTLNPAAGVAGAVGGTPFGLLRVIVRGVHNITGPGVSPVPNNNRDELFQNIAGEAGIYISEFATPTILNNVFANLQNGAYHIDSASSIVGGNLFQHNATNTNIANSANDFNFTLLNTEPLFVNAADGNFFPAPFARSIDSAVDSLEDRVAFANLKEKMGISKSPILAPDRDAAGQLRIDDPAVATPAGQGGNVFKDRGSLDRSDFVGPAAELVNPFDNDAEGVDLDGTRTLVKVRDGKFENFTIQLIDGFEAADPFPGVGVNDDTVLGAADPNGRQPGSAVSIFEDGRYLVEGVDYRYDYDPISNRIVLTPASGVWPTNRVYVIELNNRNRFVINAPHGDQVNDGDQFFITDDRGTRVTFEYDSGYSLFLPPTITLAVPAVGVSLVGISDGQRFTITSNTGVTRTFEFDQNVPAAVLPGNIPIPIAFGESQAVVANKIANAINAVTGITATAKVLSGGLVHVGVPLDYQVSSSSSLVVRPETLGIQVTAAVTDGNPFSVTNGATTFPYEFDNDSVINNPFATIINIVGLTTPAQIAAAVATSLNGTPGVGLNAVTTGGGVIYLNATPAHSLNTAGSGLNQFGLSRTPNDGQTFQIINAAGPTTVTYEFDRDPVPTFNPANTPIPYTLLDTEAELATRVAAVIGGSNVGLPAVTAIGGGQVHLGGTANHTLNLTGSPTLTQTGQPDVQPSTTLALPGPLTLHVPAIGFFGLADSRTFTITNGVTTAVFEFNLFGLPTVPGSVAINVTPVDTPNQIASNIRTAINSVVPSLGLNVTTSGPDLNLGATARHRVTIPIATQNITQTGGAPADGERFTITRGATSITFEFDTDGNATLGNARIPIAPSNTNDQIAITMRDTILNAGLSLTPTYVPSSAPNFTPLVRLNDTTQHVTNVTTAPSVLRSGVPGGAIPVPFTPSAAFTTRDELIAAINRSGLVGVSSKVRGGDSIFVDFNNAQGLTADFTGATATPSGTTGLAAIERGTSAISSFFLPAIQDLPSNTLKPNQPNNKTLFTILMPGTTLDYGDAPDDEAVPRFPTLESHNGARHVITQNPLYLGTRVDGNPDGQPVPAALGDDVDHLVNLMNSNLRLGGLAPYTLQVPAAGVPDGGRFVITRGSQTVAFEFDQNGNGISAASQIAIVYPAGATQHVIADAIVAALQSANMGLSPANLGQGRVHVGGTSLQSIDVGSTNLRAEGTPPYALIAVPGTALVDGQTFSINDGVVPTVTFEFETLLNGTNRAVPFAAGETAPQIAARLKRAIDGLGIVGLTLTELGDGSLLISGAAATTTTFNLAGTNLTLVTTPNRRLIAVPASQLGDGQTFSVQDGTNPAVTFEFGQLSNANNVAVPYASTDTAPQIAARIRSAVLGVMPLNVTLTDLGNGTLHVAGRASHSIDLLSSTLTHAGVTPVALTVPGPALGLVVPARLQIKLQKIIGGNVANGQTFLIDDGINTPVRFEFDTDGSVAAGNVAIPFGVFNAPDVIANAIAAAIGQQVTAGELAGHIVPQVDTTTDPGFILISLGATNSGPLSRTKLDVGPSGLSSNGPVNDGQTFTINDGIHSPVVFEFDSGGGSTGIAVPFTATSSASEIANATVAAILSVPSTSLSGLTPVSLGDGAVQIGGGTGASVTATGTVTATGVANGILDGQQFQLLSGLSVVLFEFDGNGRATDGAVKVSYKQGDSAATFGATLAAAIRGAGVDLGVTDLGGGVVRLEGDDEDGVRFNRPVFRGANASINVFASAPGYLNAWMDFNRDGDWADQLENIFVDRPLVAGANLLTFAVPGTAGLGETYARFRFNSEGGLTVTGLATDGEVEDYVVPVLSNLPPTVVGSGLPDLTNPDPMNPNHLRMEDNADDLIDVSPYFTDPDLLPNPNNDRLTFQVVNNTAPTLVNARMEADGRTLRLDYLFDQNGSAVITIAATDQAGVTVTDAFTVGVTAVNDRPEFVINANPPTVNEDAGPRTVANFATGVRPGPITATDEASQTVQFDVTLQSSTGNLAFAAPPTISPAGTLTYETSPDKNGTAVFEVKLRDNLLLESPPQTITITVNAVNDAPLFNIPAATAPVDEDALLQTIANFATGIAKGPPAATDELTQNLTGFNVTVPTVTGNLAFSTPPTINAAGTLTYQPAANTSGVATVVVTLADDGSNISPNANTSLPQTFAITVNAVNDAPSFTLTTTSQTVAEDTAGNVPGFATNISAGPLETQTLQFNLQLLSGSPTLFAAGPTLTPAGTLSFTPAANEFGQAVFEVTLQDNGSNVLPNRNTSATSTFTINVTSVNDAPTFTLAADPQINEDVGPQSVSNFAQNISRGASNESSQVLTFTVTGVTTTVGNVAFLQQPAIDSAGTLTYAVVPNTRGEARVTVRLSDDGGTANGGVDTSIERTFTITVLGVNDAPTFSLSNTSLTVNEDAGPQALPGFAENINLGDLGTVGTFTLTQSNFTGNLAFTTLPAIDASGTLSFTTAPDTNGSVVVTVRLQDNGGTANGGVDTSVPRSFTLNVSSVNDAPSFTLAGSAPTVLEDAGLQRVANFARNIARGPVTATDEQLQTLTFSLSTVSTTGNLAFAIQPAVDPLTGELTYQTAANTNGSIRLRLRLTDSGSTANGGVNASAPQEFLINVTAVNDAPTITLGQNVAFDEDPGAVRVPGWATGITRGGGSDEDPQVLTRFINQVASTGGLTFSATPSIDLATGDLTFTPSANSNGSATFAVTLQDNGGTANNGVDTFGPRTFTVTINPVNDPPTVANPLPNLPRPGNPPITEGSGDITINLATVFTDVELGTLSYSVTSSRPTVVQPSISGATLTLHFPPQQHGQATIAVTATDAQNGQVTNSFVVTVVPVNDPPVATDQSVQTNEDTDRAITLAGNNGDPNDAQVLTFGIASQPTNGTLVGLNPNTGQLTYRPRPNFHGTDSFTYFVTDDDTLGGPALTSLVATVSVTVIGQNDPPQVVNPIADVRVNEDAPDTSIELFPRVFGDADIATDNDALTFEVFNDNPALLRTTINPSANSVTLTLDYQPNMNSASPRNPAVIRVQAKDSQGATAEDTFTVTVDAVNDAPTATNINVSTLKNSAVSIPLVPNFAADVDGTIASATVLSNPANGTATANGTSINYVPNTNFLGVNTFTYRVTDNEGATSNVATVTVRVLERPTAVADTAATDEGKPVVINILANDSDIDGTLLPSGVIIVTQPSNGTTSVNQATGQVTYTPSGSFFGTDRFTYTVQDNDGLTSNPADVTINVARVFEWQNPTNNLDVNHDGQVSPIDALLIINRLNANLAGPLPDPPVPPFAPPPTGTAPYFDVNGDGSTTAQDALLVINRLNQISGQAGGEPEPASVVVTLAPVAAVESISPPATRKAANLVQSISPVAPPVVPVAATQGDVWDSFLDDLVSDVAGSQDRGNSHDTALEELFDEDYVD